MWRRLALVAVGGFVIALLLDNASEGTHVIEGMLIVGLIFSAVAAWLWWTQTAAR